MPRNKKDDDLKNHDAADSNLEAFQSIIDDINRRQHLTKISSASVKMNFVLSALLCISLIGNIILGQKATNPDRQYFATENGNIIPLVPTNQPYQKSGDVIAFAQATLTNSFNLNFEQYRMQIEGIRERYTNAGLESYIAGLKESGLIDTIKEKRYVMTISTETGVLIKEGNFNGVYTWIIEFPIEIKLSANEKRPVLAETNGNGKG